MEDNLKILNLSLDDRPIFTDPENEDDLQWKNSSKYYKWNISATTY